MLTSLPMLCHDVKSSGGRTQDHPTRAHGVIRRTICHILAHGLTASLQKHHHFLIFLKSTAEDQLWNYESHSKDIEYEIRAAVASGGVEPPEIKNRNSWRCHRARNLQPIMIFSKMLKLGKDGLLNKRNWDPRPWSGDVLYYYFIYLFSLFSWFERFKILRLNQGS